MANLMVRELEFSADLDKRALMNIAGGVDCCCLDMSKCNRIGEPLLMAEQHIATFDGQCCCVGTVLDDDNRLRQIWTKEWYQVFYKRFQQEFRCDFCAVGCP
ncbi:MAG: hypothetical protein R2941_19490 [Desulfobacterales bacterium]